MKVHFSSDGGCNKCRAFLARGRSDSRRMQMGNVIGAAPVSLKCIELNPCMMRALWVLLDKFVPMSSEQAVDQR